jgi:hypothetical protein
VLERRCRKGGFCFYKLEEPNGSDTWHALAILDLLEAQFEDPATIAYLKRMQRADGAYDSIYAAYYAIKSLALLGETPSLDPRPYVLRNLEHYRFDVKRLPAEVISMFRRTSYLVELYGVLGMDTDRPLRDNMVDFILGFQNEDGGFGYLSSTLLDTARALAMLKNLGQPLEDRGTEGFIRLCEVPFYGFTDIPHTTLSFLEYIHAGILASYLVSRRPRYRDQCEAYVVNCQNRMGGFSRTMQGGIATLENTWHAVHALTMLSSWATAWPGIVPDGLHRQRPE